jgi:hypothetical protein
VFADKRRPGNALAAGHFWKSRLPPTFRNVLWIAVKLSKAQKTLKFSRAKPA